MRGGTYTGDYICELNGTSDDPITIRPYQSEQVIIDGSLTINGSYTVWDGMGAGIVTYSGWSKRTTDEGGSDPTDIPDNKVVTINAPGCVFRNWILHDLAGFEIWTPAVQALIYGNVVYNIGWNSTADRGHGHLFYTQNDASTGRKTYKHNIAFSSFSTGLKIYTEGGKASGFDVLNNTILNSAVLYDGDDYGMNYWFQDPSGLDYTFRNNRGYHAKATGDPVRLGLYDPATNVRITDNYWPEGCISDEGNQLVEDSGNTIGTIGNVVFVEPNDYITTRAHVTVYNEAGANSVTVDLTTVTGLSVGDTVTAWNVQAGVGNDLQTLTLDANKCIVVDMQAANRSVSAPIGWTAPETTFPTFGCFVINKV